MNKAVFSLLCLSGVATAAASCSVYCGFGPSAMFMTSEFNMDFEVNQNNTGDETGGRVHQKFNGKSKIGADIFLGVSGGACCYYAAEIGATLNKHNLTKEFSDYEAKEFGHGIYDRTGAIHTRLENKYGNEYSFVLKLGRRFPKKALALYGILGASIRSLNTRYDYMADNLVDADLSGFAPYYSHHYKKNINALILGAGLEKKISNRFSWSVEYKHKFAKNARSSKDLRDVPPIVYPGVLAAGDLDTSVRNYNVKTSQNMLSLRFIYSIKTK